MCRYCCRDSQTQSVQTEEECIEPGMCPFVLFRERFCLKKVLSSSFFSSLSLNFVILFFSLFFCEMAHLHTKPPTRRAFNGATNRSPFFHLSLPFLLLPLLRFFSQQLRLLPTDTPFLPFLSRCGDFNERRRKTIFHLLLLSAICCGKSFFLLFGQSSHSLPRPTGPLFRQRRASQIMCPFSLSFFGEGIWGVVVACGYTPSSLV